MITLSAGMTSCQKTKNKHGFTLAELLIVVAIIGVLVAVSIPIFTSQLKKSKLATNQANARAAYAAATAERLERGDTGDNYYGYDVATGEISFAMDYSDANKNVPVGCFSNDISGWTYDGDNPTDAQLGEKTAYSWHMYFIVEDDGTETVHFLPFYKSGSSGSGSDSSGGSGTSTPSYAGQASTAEELANSPTFMYISGNKINAYSSENYGSYYLVDAEINKVYKIQSAYHETGSPKYYRYDGTDWYGCWGEGSPWTKLKP